MAIIDDQLNDEGHGALVVWQQQSTGCDDQIDYPYLSAMKPEGVETAQEKRFILVITTGGFTKPGGRFKQRAHPKFPLKRKKRCPAGGAKSAKSDKDGNYVPPRKRRRQVATQQAPALRRATKVQEELPGECPRFTKHMLKSHVAHPFWLGVPCDFCKSYLSEHDVKITLEDAHGQSHRVNYLHARKGLSGGWASFARKHCLNVGDAVVFRLVEPTKFKVHIIRGNGTKSGDDKYMEDPYVTRASSSACEEALDVDDMRI